MSHYRSGKETFPTLTEKYRHLQLLLKHFNLAYAPVALLSMETVVVVVVVLAFVGACRIDGMIRYALGILAFVCYLVVIISFGTSAVSRSVTSFVT